MEENSLKEKSLTKIGELEQSLNELKIVAQRAHSFYLKIVGEEGPDLEKELPNILRSLSGLLEDAPVEIIQSVKILNHVFHDLEKILFS